MDINWKSPVYEFDPEQWAKLPIEDRVRACRSMASNARRFAETAYPECKKNYLRLADQWDALASEVAAVDANWKGRSLQRTTTA